MFNEPKHHKTGKKATEAPRTNETHPEQKNQFPEKRNKFRKIF